MSQTPLDFRRAALLCFLIFGGGLAAGGGAVFLALRSNPPTQTTTTPTPEAPKTVIQQVPVPTTPTLPNLPPVPPVAASPGAVTPTPSPTQENFAIALPQPNISATPPQTTQPTQRRTPQLPDEIRRQIQRPPRRIVTRAIAEPRRPVATRPASPPPRQPRPSVRPAPAQQPPQTPLPAPTRQIEPEPPVELFSVASPPPIVETPQLVAPIVIPPAQIPSPVAIAPVETPLPDVPQTPAPVATPTIPPSPIEPIAPVDPTVTQIEPLLPPPEETPTPESPPPVQRTATALSPLQLNFQGAYLQQDLPSVRARVTMTYPFTPNLLVGATVEAVKGTAFADTRSEGFNVNELYFATSLPSAPNLRFVVGQIDLTSYFDRNSFAKDATTHFFHPLFQTNPALSTSGIGSRPGILANWSLTDNVEAKAAVFSSARDLEDFALDGFAAEVGVRYGNAIIRGTYTTNRDAGLRDGFAESFRVLRGDGRQGVLFDDREEAYGINFEAFVPEIKMGIFGRYGWHRNRDLDLWGDTYSIGLNFLDVLTPSDRLGVAYGRGLSNDRLRRQAGDDLPTVLELFYDLRVLPNLRAGFTFQQVDNFSDTILGFRLKTEFNVTPFERQR